MSEEVSKYDVLAAEADRRAFTFSYQGREWSIRHMADLDYRLARDGALKGDLDAIDKLFRRGMGQEQFAAWEAETDVPSEVLKVIFDDYLEHCGTSRGKSQDSTPSSGSTETPSKPASKPRTKSTSRASSTGRSRRAGSTSS
jgi:hypothetical protein